MSCIQVDLRVLRQLNPIHFRVDHATRPTTSTSNLRIESTYRKRRSGPGQDPGGASVARVSFCLFCVFATHPTSPIGASRLDEGGHLRR